MEDTGKSGQKSLDLQQGGFKCRLYNLRVGFLVLLVLSLLIWYYLNSDIFNVWTKIHILCNTTFFKNYFEFCKPIPEVCNLFNSKYQVAYPCTYHYVINEKERCIKDKPFLVLMVPVEPSNRRARDIIRRTWGSEKKVIGKRVSVFFMLGQTDAKFNRKYQKMLQRESQIYHDIVQSDFLDSYNNLTIKTMVIMEWLASNCDTASYAMKIDSDIFLNVKNLVNMLIPAPRNNYMTGLVAHGAMVIRDPKSKWYFPEDVFPEGNYPPYALGLGYVYSIDLPKKLVEGAKHLVTNVYIEDVNVGLIMKHLDLPFTSQSDQSLFNVFPVPFNRCRYSKLIATTTNKLSEIEMAWLQLNKAGPFC
ncbi:beta-1,3-galactosyltransferase 1 [Salminus brasiliensis]|uniref:beta-1,3-galactosyltransferase 1 n=1 Tax=Salminus brasiliensis TaxID=930266 RepID=UPI003B83869F